MSRSNVLERFEKQDFAFWDSVTTFLSVLGLHGFQLQYYKHTLSLRIIATPSINDPFVSAVYSFFSYSPDHFIPLNGCACEMGGADGPIAFGEKELLIKIWKLSDGHPYHLQLTELFRQIEPFFKEGDDICWDTQRVNAYREENLPITFARQHLTQMHTQWIKYIRRHFNRALLGIDDQSKLSCLIRCVESLCNHDHPNPTLSVGSICYTMDILDDTLYFAGHPSTEMLEYTRRLNAPYPGPVMSKALLMRLMKSQNIPAKYTYNMARIFRLQQKVAISERKMTDADKPKPCFIYVYDQKEYRIIYDKASGQFSYPPYSCTPPTITRKARLPANLGGCFLLQKTAL